VDTRVPLPVDDNLCEVFFDGTNYYNVIAPLPALFPLTGSKGQSGSGTPFYVLLLCLYAAVGGFVCLLLDRRWKVAVVRHAPGPFKRWYVISAEFFEDADDAVARGCEILATWDPERLARAETLRWKELNDLRRVSRVGSSGDGSA